ncbi:hypothetical protein PN497_20080 [Sphaerospermopsis kisseleviana CS-549]|uniref:Uncharacterized protein n=1 Tax=Sphaerospermopsis kisseleviana CS-549 TaxID=3021783 RepID=A0ABT4ZW40_9CYAN|nr:hypothetical protein [Sphaerospermopsis kisseleviana]MDB9443631.1 hypothetical protein [Sphaerospermopsis kisseleviana CS-549]BAZ81079.1 hypothetical protein NIES73_23450 [Sphaerospermopsis kisseleviana NIES-73]
MTNISIKEISKQLSIDEDVIRFALADRYPDNYESIKDIPLSEYEVIVESLKLAASQGIKKLTGTSFEDCAIAQMGESAGLTNETKEQIYNGCINSLSDFYGSYHLSILQINEALAYVSAQKTVNDFVTIHSETVRNGLETYLDDFANQASEAAQLVMASDANEFLAARGINSQGKKKSVATMKAMETSKAIFSLMKS